MDKKLIILVIIILCLPLFACGGGAPENEAPTESTEVETLPEEPTTAPESTQPTTIMVTGVDQIVGTWIAAADLGMFVAVVSPDGMFRVATSSEDMAKGSTNSWMLTIEDDQISATDYALCLGDTGHYLAEIKADGTLKFFTISDPCTGRIRKMDRSLPGRLTP